MKSWFEAGALVNIAEFLSDGELRELLLKLSEYGEFFNDKTKREIFLLEKREDLIDYLSKLIKEASKPLNELNQGVSNNIIGFMTPEVQELLNLHLEQGHLWIKFEKDNQNKLTLTIFVSGGALNRNKQWPLRIEGVDPTKVNIAFFERLLDYETKDQVNTKDLFEGVFAYLEGTIVSKDVRVFHKRTLTKGEMVQAVLGNAEIHPEKITLEMHLEAIIRYCASYLTKDKNQLILKDGEDYQPLAQAILTVVKEAKALPKGSLSPAKMRAILATQAEIFEAIRLAQPKPSASATEGMGHLRDALIASGISLTQIQWAKGPLLGH